MNEKAFREWYARWAKIAGLDPDPDNPLHKYDYRAAFRAGVEPQISPEDGLYHWPSQFKAADHPNRFVNGVDTRAEDRASAARAALGSLSQVRPDALAGIGGKRPSARKQAVGMTKGLAGAAWDFAVMEPTKQMAEAIWNRSLPGVAFGLAAGALPLGRPGRTVARAGKSAFKEVTASEFDEVLKAFAKHKPDEAGFITWRTPEQMNAEGMKMFLSPDKTAGYAVHPETGDIRNVFNFPESAGGVKGRGAEAVAHAVENSGGRVLDAFDTRLTDIYKNLGFRETWRSPWDDQFRPSNWNETKYGRPDVIGMEFAGPSKKADDIMKNYAEARKAKPNAPRAVTDSAAMQAIKGLPMLNTGKRSPLEWNEFTAEKSGFAVPGDRRFVFTMPEGNQIEVIGQKKGDDFRVSWAGALNRGVKKEGESRFYVSGAGEAGAGHMRQIGRQLRDITGAKTISGERISGARPFNANSELGGGREAKRVLSDSAYTRVLDAAFPSPAVRTPPPVWKPTERGVFDRSVPPLQGKAPIPPQLATPSVRGGTSMLTDAVTSSDIVKQGMRADMEKGLPLGGSSWYEPGPIKANLESGGPLSFNDFTNISGSSSMQNSVPNELSTFSVLNRALSRGLTWEQAVKDMQKVTGTNLRPWGNQQMLEHAKRAVKTGVQAPASPASGTGWKVPWYAQGRLGGNPEAGVALDTHERRRLWQLAMKDPDIREMVSLIGMQPDKDVLPIQNAMDYDALSGLYRNLAKEAGLPSPQAAQAGRWIGGGEHTGLKSPALGDLTQIIEDGLLYSANSRGFDTSPAGLRKYWDRIKAGEDFFLPFYRKGGFPVY